MMPQFMEPDWDLTCDEAGYPWDSDVQDGNLGNDEEDFE